MTSAAKRWPTPTPTRARATGYHPDIALINHYTDDARLGMHRDSDEHAPDPVVSISLGAPCLFRLGNPHSRGRPWTDVELRSGDLLVFGDESRLAYHGVPKLLPHSPAEIPEIGLGAGRLNITLRVSGLQPDDRRRGSAVQNERRRGIP